MKSQVLAFFQKFFVTLAAFLLPIRPMLLVVGVLIAIDTAAGLFRARKAKEKISSRRLSNVISKMVLYQSAVILIYAMELYVLQDFIAMFIDMHLIATKLVVITISSIELTSIRENYKGATGVDIFSGFKDMLVRAKEVKKSIDDLKEDEKD